MSQLFGFNRLRDDLMEIDAIPQDFVDWIAEIIHIIPRASNGNYIFDIPINSGETKPIEVILSEIDEHLRKLAAKEEIEETTIYEKRSFELLVREGSAYPGSYRMRFRDPDAKIVKNDVENGIIYTFSRPSDEYLLYLIYRIAKINALRSVWDPFIIEYFFERVFNEELITRVKNKITLPDFSYKRESDIKQLIEEIKKSLKVRRDDTTFSEEEALRLTIVRYVDLVVLIQELNEYDNSLIAYYKTNTVSFSKGNIIDLENSDIPSVYKSISKRIYKTRNSIVHSKESDRSRYIPFEHDKRLVKEVPLLRFIAELIIMNTSNIIE